MTCIRILTVTYTILLPNGWKIMQIRKLIELLWINRENCAYQMIKVKAVDNTIPNKIKQCTTFLEIKHVTSRTLRLNHLKYLTTVLRHSYI